ncbi:MAG: DUF4091 domain-containing protein, partial [Clostridia bacterium]|nr:DUF4091 domain-containing protein [Clostridia bacterium]
VLASLMLIPTASAVFAEDAAPATGLVLAEGSHLVLDTEKGYVDKIDGTITVGELKANFAGNVDIAGKADDAAVATDDVIGDSTALIYGDVNRDGKITLSDVSGILQNIASWNTDVNTDAADVDKTGAVNLSDITKVLKYIAGWDDISLGNVRMIFENKKIDAENEDATLQLSFTSIMNKVGATQIQTTGEYSYKIKTARNEYESCTVLLYSDTAKEGMTAELSDFVSEFGDAVLDAELEWVQYIPNYSVFKEIDASDFDIQYANREENLIYDDMPEVVLKMADTFELKAERLQQFVITTHTTKETPAGMYKATLTFKDAEGKEVKKADVYAQVYDFTLPDAPYSASLFAGAGRYNVENCEFLLENNISSYVLPYDITDERADAYMSDPRVTAFVIAGGGIAGYGRPGMYGGLMDRTEEETVASYNKVASNPEWFKKGLFYYTDEPYGEGLFQVRDSYNYVTELLGTTNIRNMTPFGQSYPSAEYQNKGIDSVEFIKDYINVWVPISSAYHRVAEGGNWTPRYILNKHGEYYERAETFRERGDDIWWYVCCAPEVPYANYFTCYQGVINRLLSWQQYFNDVNGVLYYQTLGGNISKFKFDIGNGDGILSYEGKYWGREGYAESWRLLQVRDGFDDFDYLRMAEELVGRDTVMEVVKKVSSGMLLYTEDYRVLEAARDEIIDLILEAQAK